MKAQKALSKSEKIKKLEKSIKKFGDPNNNKKEALAILQKNKCLCSSLTVSRLNA